MAELLKVPEVAAGATEVVLSEWTVAEGAACGKGDPLVVIETDKATVEVEAESDAVLLRALVPAGSSVEVGAPLALLGAESERDADLDAILADLGVRDGDVATSPAPARREVPDVEAESPTPPAEESAPVADVVPVDAPSGAPDPARGGRVFVSPIARKLLREAGLGTDGIEGTGPGGRIVRRDVFAAIAARPEEPAAVASAPAPAVAATSEEVPHSRLRRAVARRLTESKATVPHFYLRREVRVDALLALRAQLNEVATQRVSVNDLVLRAVAVAYAQVPEANVTWTDEAMLHHAEVDVSVAIDSARGLVTPVLRDLGAASPTRIAREVRELVAAADAGSLRQHQLEGGAMSVSNLGMLGVDEFSAIINPPQSMILAVGAATQKPVVVDGSIEAGTCMNLVLSVDHRAIDGALAARFAAALVQAVEQPIRLLLET